jgi:hypothetical protein
MVIILSQDDKRFFGRREFAGYLRLRIPHPLDAKVLSAIQDARIRTKMGPGDVGVLSVFGHRTAVESVRSSSLDVLRQGFLAIAVAIDLDGDMREVFRSLAPLFHSARLLNVTDEEILSSLRPWGASAMSVEEIRRFSERPENAKSISAMGIREEGFGEQFRYV